MKSGHLTELKNVLKNYATRARRIAYKPYQTWRLSKNNANSNCLFLAKQRKLLITAKKWTDMGNLVRYIRG